MAAAPDASRRHDARDREILEAARRVFDERGMQDAPMGEIAQAVGINRVILYRHFSSKEELFALTVASYLDELADRMASIDPALGPAGRLEAIADTFAAYCLEYPAFLDCCLSLMRRPAVELRASLSPAGGRKLGLGMARCLGHLERALQAACDAGLVELDDIPFTANRLYAQALGTMHLARIGIGISEPAPGAASAFEVSPEAVRRSCARDLMRVVGLSTGPSERSG